MRVSFDAATGNLAKDAKFAKYAEKEQGTEIRNIDTLENLAFFASLRESDAQCFRNRVRKTMLRAVTRAFLFMGMTALLASCGESAPEFRTRDITGLMPELQFELTRAADGATVTGQDYRGRVTVVFFGFTNCPDVCPTTLARFSAALSKLEGKAADEVRILFVSVDPKRDTRERLHGYVSAFGPQFTGLRGPQEELREVTKRYRVTYGYGEPDESGFYEVSHSSAAFVFDRDGEIRLLLRQDDPIEDIAHDLAILAQS